MSSPERGPLDALKAVAWTFLLVVGVLWLAVWLLSQIYVWLIIIAGVTLVVWLLLWWRRRRW